MSNTLLKIKRSAVKGKSPTTSNVSLGELALNTNDGRLFFKTTDSSGTSAIATLREISGGTGITATDGVLSLDNQVTAQTVGNATTVPRLTINAQGQITGVTTATVAGVSGFDFDSSNGTLTITTSAGNFSDVLTLDPYTTTDLTEGTNQYHTTARARGAISATGSLSYNSSTGVIDFTERTDAEVRGLISASGDISYNNSTGVISFSETAAPVTSVNSETGAVTLTTNDIAEGGGVLYYTTARFDSDFGDNSTSDLSEGTNLYHTTARARGAISATNTGTGYGALSYTSGTGALSFAKVTNANIRSAVSAGTGITYNSSTGVIGTSITQYTSNMADSDARHAISVTDNGGDGSLSYTPATGVIAYTGPSASEVRAHISAGTGVSISSGQISIGQAVGTTDDVTFNDVTVSGDLTVSGDETTLNVATLSVEDKNIVVGNNATSSAQTDGAGLTFGAWSSGTIPVLKWDHGNSRFDFNKPLKASSFVGNITGNVTGTVSDISNHSTADLTEDSSNLYFTNARARSALSASSGIDYNSSTGAFTADQGEIRGFFSASGDLSYNNSTGEFSFSETYSTASELLTALKTVDTNSSGLNADTLDGQEGTHYRINVYNSSGTLLN